MSTYEGVTCCCESFTNVISASFPIVLDDLYNDGDNKVCMCLWGVVEWKWLCGVEVAVTSEYARVEGTICTLEVVQCVV